MAQSYTSIDGETGQCGKVFETLESAPFFHIAKYEYGQSTETNRISMDN